MDRWAQFLTYALRLPLQPGQSKLSGSDLLIAAPKMRVVTQYIATNPISPRNDGLIAETVGGAGVTLAAVLGFLLVATPS